MNDINIILPVHNEKVALEFVLQDWTALLKKLHLRYIFIICEDGSTDGTKEILYTLQRKYPILLNQQPYRRGYGPSVIDGISSAKGKYILCIDSDGQCDPNDFPKFWAQRDKNIVLIGWRIERADARSRKLYSSLFNKLFSWLFPGSPHDPSAPYVLFTKEKISPYKKYLQLLKEGFWWGFVGTCIKYKIPVKELPINHRKRIDGKTQVYSPNRIPFIAATNIIGLIKLRFMKP